MRTTLDWAWAQRTDGNLSRTDRRALVGPLLAALPRLAVERSRSLCGQRGTASWELVGLSWPDTRLARAAEVEARAVLSPHVLEHSYRSYLFGLVLAAVDGVETDEELAFTACMLHDLQLEAPTPRRCFAVVGARRAHAFALDHGAPPEVAERIAGGVSGHLTPGVADDLTDLAGFVSAGALVDVAGSRLQEFDRQWVADVLARHPRHDFKRHLRAAIAQEARMVPDGRTAWLIRWARFQTLIAIAPFRD
jgi:hypothetical protein